MFFCFQKISNPLGLFCPNPNWRDLIFLAKIIGLALRKKYEVFDDLDMFLYGQDLGSCSL